MNLVFAVIIGFFFSISVYVFARAFISKNKEKLDKVAKHYGYRDFKHLEKIGKKEEKLMMRELKKDDRRRRYGK